MSHYYTDIKAAIVSFIQTSTNNRNVYAYEETKPAGYPAIMVTPFGGQGIFLDTMRVQRDFQFTVRVYQERLDATPAGAEAIITTLVDELIGIFEGAGASNLNNTVVFTQPPSVKFGYLQSPDPDVRTAEITLVCRAAQ